MEPLKDLLSKTFQATWKIKLLTDWPHIMGNLADKVSLEKIYDDTLILGVNNGSWLQELYLLSSTLIKMINEHLETPRIKILRFKQSSKQSKKELIYQVSPILAPKKKYILKLKEQKALESINDIELKNALHSFLERCQKDKS